MHCLDCGTELDDPTPTNPEHPTPKPGDILLCAGCGHVMVAGDDGAPRAPTDAELIELAGHPHLLALQQARGWQTDEPIVVATGGSPAERVSTFLNGVKDFLRPGRPAAFYVGRTRSGEPAIMLRLAEGEFPLMVSEARWLSEIITKNPPRFSAGNPFQGTLDRFIKALHQACDRAEARYAMNDDKDDD